MHGRRDSELLAWLAAGNGSAARFLDFCVLKSVDRSVETDKVDIRIRLSIYQDRHAMHLSQTIEYALRATVWLAENPGVPQTTQQIADACKAPPSYLAKVMQALVRGGVISAQRGPGGGFILERDLESLTLLDVVSAIEPIQRVRGCPLEIPGHDVELCPLHKVLDRALQACHDVLAQHRIAEMVNQGCFARPMALADQGAAAVGSLNQGNRKSRLA